MSVPDCRLPYMKVRDWGVPSVTGSVPVGAPTSHLRLRCVCDVGSSCWARVPGNTFLSNCPQPTGSSHALPAQVTRAGFSEAISCHCPKRLSLMCSLANGSYTVQWPVARLVTVPHTVLGRTTPSNTTSIPLARIQPHVN